MILTRERLDLPRYVAFRVTFSSNREPILVARAKGMGRSFFWTSIPERRQKEAEGVGNLIEEYLLDKEQVMCYYNRQKITREEYIRLRRLEKLVANYKFLNRDVEVGFDFGPTVVLKPICGKENFEIVEME